jgi:chromosome segregation ATPase
MSKIIQLSAENIKRLRAVQIALDPKMPTVTLTGRNGAGKSSVLDAIMYALGGKDTICDAPVRKGANKGTVSLTLDNGLRVERRFTASGSTVRVFAADEEQRTPQSILDALVGQLAFDPLAFARYNAREQAATLLQLSELDCTALDAEIQVTYDARAEYAREAETNDRALAVLPCPKTKPEHEPAYEQLSVEIAAENAVIAEHQSFQQACTNLGDSIMGMRSFVLRTKAEIDRLSKQRDDAAAELTLAERRLCTLQTQLASLPRTAGTLEERTASLAKRLSALEAERAAWDLHQRRALITKACDTARSLADRAHTRLEKLRQVKIDALAAAPTPLLGLSFDSDGVAFNGIPFAQLSSGEQLRVSVAVGMALNPTLRVIFVRDGSLLDAEGLATIASLAAEHDYQVWVEDSRSTDPRAIVIEDGCIVPA